MTHARTHAPTHPPTHAPTHARTHARTRAICKFAFTLFRRIIKMGGGRSTFQIHWLRDRQYMLWLEQVHADQTLAHCRLCRKDFKLTGHGESALKSHAQGKKHENLHIFSKRIMLCLQLNQYLDQRLHFYNNFYFF